MFRLAPLILMLLAAPARAGGPIAEVVCGDREALVARLSGSMAATPVAAGLRDAEALMEVWAAEDGDWTLVQTHANGMTCILAMGENWHQSMPPAGDAGGAPGP
jgi:hypothetical protein